MEKRKYSIFLLQAGHIFEIQDTLAEDDMAQIKVCCMGSVKIRRKNADLLLRNILAEENGKSPYITFAGGIRDDRKLYVAGCVKVQKDTTAFLRTRIIRSLMTATLLCVEEAEGMEWNG